MLSEQIDPVEVSYAQRVGARLRTVRRQKGLSLQDVESGSQQEFKASVLGAYERGERAISVPRLYRLARFYSVPVDRLLPSDPGPVVAEATRHISLVDEPVADRSTNGERHVSIDLTRVTGLPEREASLLGRYLNMIQLQRQDFNGRVLTVRRDDVRAIACMLETTPEGLRHHLDQLGVRLIP